MNDDQKQHRQFEEHLQLIDARCNSIEAAVSAVKADTAAIVEAWTAIAGGLKVLGWLGTVAKWLAPILAVCAAAWALLNGRPPQS